MGLGPSDLLISESTSEDMILGNKVVRGSRSDDNFILTLLRILTVSTRSLSVFRVRAQQFGKVSFKLTNSWKLYFLSVKQKFNRYFTLYKKEGVDT